MEDNLQEQRMMWSPENGLPTIHKPIQCSNCKHRHEDTIACDAFDSIPSVILEDQFDHTKPYPGDRGIRFEEQP
jgi:hypothetical protein